VDVWLDADTLFWAVRVDDEMAGLGQTEHDVVVREQVATQSEWVS
jgi:hypothetical protein